MNRVVGLLRGIIFEIWGEEPARPKVWNDRAERTTLDERSRWFVMR
jgi:hypothetical protein